MLIGIKHGKVKEKKIAKLKILLLIFSKIFVINFILKYNVKGTDTHKKRTRIVSAGR